MERLGITCGTAFLGGAPLDDVEERTVATERGEVVVLVGKGFACLLRHGRGVYRPPHRIPHHAHVLAFEALGVARVVGLCSAGSLRVENAPGTVVVPDDYLSVHAPPTFAEDERLHIVPRLDEGLRALLLAAARDTEGPVVSGGVYVETRGPRFETRAEVRRLADHGDVVGMTAASEATLHQERGIAYANLCMVDNLAHGLGTEPLTFRAFECQVEANAARTGAILARIVERHREDEAS